MRFDVFFIYFTRGKCAINQSQHATSPFGDFRKGTRLPVKIQIFLTLQGREVGLKAMVLYPGGRDLLEYCGQDTLALYEMHKLTNRIYYDMIVA